MEPVTHDSALNLAPQNPQPRKFLKKFNTAAFLHDILNMVSNVAYMRLKPLHTNQLFQLYAKREIEEFSNTIKTANITIFSNFFYFFMLTLLIKSSNYYCIHVFNAYCAFSSPYFTGLTSLG